MVGAEVFGGLRWSISDIETALGPGDPPRTGMGELGQMSLGIPALALTLTWAEVEKLSQATALSASVRCDLHCGLQSLLRLGLGKHDPFI